jgi:hypothetical protein
MCAADTAAPAVLLPLLCCCSLLTYYTLNCGLDFPSSSNGSSSSSKQSPASIDEDDEDWTPFADPSATVKASKAAAAAANPLTEAVLPLNESDKSVPVLFLHGVGECHLLVPPCFYELPLGPAEDLC